MDTKQNHQEIIAKVLAGFNGKTEEIIPLLQKIQNELGFLSEEAMSAIANFTKVSESNVYGVATFYPQFRFSPRGKYHVIICRGTACHVRGAPLVIDAVKAHLHLEEGASTTDGNYSLETTSCLGCCSLAPCVMVNGKVEAKVNPKDIPKLFSVVESGEQG